MGREGWLIANIGEALYRLSTLAPARSATIAAERVYLVPLRLSAALLASTLVSGLLLYFAACRRSIIARGIVALWAIAVVISLIVLAVTRQLNGSGFAISSYICDVILLVCAWLLFKPDASAWFRREWTDPKIGEAFE